MKQTKKGFMIPETLSDKRIKVIDLPREGMFQRLVIPTDDVKEFIQKLKEELKRNVKNHHSWTNIEFKIDNLAGDKLVNHSPQNGKEQLPKTVEGGAGSEDKPLNHSPQEGSGPENRVRYPTSEGNHSPQAEASPGDNPLCECGHDKFQHLNNKSQCYHDECKKFKPLKKDNYEKTVLEHLKSKKKRLLKKGCVIEGRARGKTKFSKCPSCHLIAGIHEDWCCIKGKKGCGINIDNDEKIIICGENGLCPTCSGDGE